ncbi:unnamed protein product [Polarella glacialis]|uniref:AB hydrolase-1 domain-containing protein n=1 Tax=Polarella glacialis TaxID=89957 RepID=A0A813GJS1_POLGL|nr:unnamed protein product [Polarella glacialis]
MPRQTRHRGFRPLARHRVAVALVAALASAVPAATRRIADRCFQTTAWSLSERPRLTTSASEAPFPAVSSGGRFFVGRSAGCPSPSLRGIPNNNNNNNLLTQKRRNGRGSLRELRWRSLSAVGFFPVLGPDTPGILFAALLAGISGLAALLAKGYGAVLLFLILLQRKLLFTPPPEFADPSATGGEVILLPVGSTQLTRAAVYFAPRSPQAPVLVFFHGNGDQLGWSAAYLGQRMRDEFGTGFLGIEYPGYGLAEGTPSEASFYEASEQMLRHLAQERGLQSSQVVLLGHSVGGGVATEMALRGLGSRLILVSPFLSIPEMACELYPFVAPVLKVAPFLIRDRFDNAAKAASLKLPVLIVHGTDDDIVPFSQGQLLSEKVKGSKLVAVRGVGHNDVFDHDIILDEIAAFARA